jgi:hypothetical protein
MVKKFSKEQFEISYYLGSLVSKENKFFQDVACMTPKWRMIVGLLEILKKVNSNDTEMIKQIDTFLKPICQIMGQAEWQPDIITNLAMKLGENTETYDAL